MIALTYQNRKLLTESHRKPFNLFNLAIMHKTDKRHLGKGLKAQGTRPYEEVYIQG